MNKRGQLSIVNIIFFLILVGVAVVVSPIMDDFCEDAVDNNNWTGTKALIVNNITVVFWLGVIVTFFMYLTPIRPQQY